MIHDTIWFMKIHPGNSCITHVRCLVRPTIPWNLMTYPCVLNSWKIYWGPWGVFQTAICLFDREKKTGLLWLLTWRWFFPSLNPIPKIFFWLKLVSINVASRSTLNNLNRPCHLKTRHGIQNREMFLKKPILLMEGILLGSLSHYFKVLYIPGGLGFLPSTVILWGCVRSWDVFLSISMDLQKFPCGPSHEK